MNERTFLVNRLRRRWVVVAAAIALAGGGAIWRGSAAVASDAQEGASKPGAHAAAAAASRSANGIRDSYADVVKIVAPAVVTIRVEGRARYAPTQFFDGDEFFRRFFGDPDDRPRRQTPRSFRQRGLGSGVIMSSDGYILTNYHVIDGADDIRVDLTDGRTLAAKVIGSDRPSDLALLKVNATDLHPLVFGDSDAVQVGDVVLAVGNPLGIGQTVTMGIVSAKGRATGAGDGSYEDFLQTDAPINHGNSGGALVNTRGELVGINSQILSNTGENIGIGFAIPVNMARHVVEQLRTTGKVRRAQLGVTIQPVTSDMAESLGLKEVGGVIISSVTPGSAADRAGLKQGDVIESFNGERVKDSNALRNRVANSEPGSTATLDIVRDGSKRKVTVKLDELAPDRTARRDGRGGSSDSTGGDDRTALGIAVAPITPELARRYDLPRNAKGVFVEDVDPDGRAADAGIQQGDIIEQVNREPVNTVEELRNAVRRSPDKPLLLLVNRDGREIFVTVRPAA